MIETKITDLKKFNQKLKGLAFTLTPIKEKKGQYRLRIGKKYIIVDCPSKEIGDSTKNAIMSALKQTSDKVTQIIDYIENNAKQLELSLFPVTEEGVGSDGESKECSDRS